MYRLFIFYVLLCASIQSFASITIDNIKYSIKSTGNATVIGYTTGLGSVVTIPDTIIYQKEHIVVNRIGAHAFQYSSIRNIILPNTISDIEAYAFSTSSLETINLPNSIFTIGKYAFEKTKLTTISIPDSVSNIENGLFQFCYELNHVTMPNDITKIGDNVFYECHNLKDISLPNSVTSIGKSAFELSGIESINLSNSIISIGDSAFKETDLTSIILPNSITSIGASAFQKTALTSITLPNSITSIGEYAFKETNLTSITLPNSITSIANGTFYDCKELATVDIPNSIITIGSRAFQNCVNLKTIELPNNLESLGGYAFDGCQIPSLTIPTSLTQIYGGSSLCGIKNIYVSYKMPPIISGDYLEESIIYVPWGTKSNYIDSGWNKSLGIRSYEKVPSLDVNLTTPGTLVNHLDINNILSIGNLKIRGAINGTDLIAINRMKNLDEIDLSEASIVDGGLPYYQTNNESYYTTDNHFGYKSFHNIWPYKVYLPKVQVIEKCPLNSNCIEYLYMPDEVEEIGDNAFSNALISEINLPYNLKSIGTEAFYKCRNLKYVQIPPSVTILSPYSFSHCENLRYINIPKSVEKCSYPFNRCHFSKIIIENSSKELANYTGITSDNSLTIVDSLYVGRNTDNFYYWVIQNELIIGPDVTTIYRESFRGSFTKISFPKSITSIGEKAFQTSTIVEVCSENPEPPEISENTFTAKTYSQATLYVPNNALISYWLHPYWSKFSSIKTLDDLSIIQSPQIHDITININGNTINIENSNNTYFQIYDITGKQIYHGKQTTVSNIPTGIYILKSGKQTIKFAITI